MKNRQTAALLCLCTALTCLGWAQNGGSSAASQTASQSADRKPLQTPVPNDFWDGEDPNLANLVTHPFANKAYVQRQTRPIRDRLAELDQMTAENSRMTRDVDTRAQQGIQLASEKSSVADQHATDALSRAQTAQSAGNDASAHISSVEQMVANLDQYRGTAQTEIRFRAGQTVLSKNAKNALDTIAISLKDQRNYILEIHGFAPGRSRTAVANSKRMSNSVVRYLVQTHKIPLYRIYVLNMASSGSGKSRRGRVEVSVLENASVTAQR